MSIPGTDGAGRIRPVVGARRNDADNSPDGAAQVGVKQTGAGNLDFAMMLWGTARRRSGVSSEALDLGAAALSPAGATAP